MKDFAIGGIISVIITFLIVSLSSSVMYRLKNYLYEKVNYSYLNDSFRDFFLKLIDKFEAVFTLFILVIVFFIIAKIMIPLGFFAIKEIFNNSF